MRFTVATWNTQGYNINKLAEINRLANSHNVDVFFIQEAGALANPGGVAGWNKVGWPGTDTDGYANNRVSLAILSNAVINNHGYQNAPTRGLGWIDVGGMIFGTWHENRGQGGLAGCLQQIQRDRDITDCIVGGDFNTESQEQIMFGTNRTGRYRLHTSNYNLAYSGTKTHPGSDRNLDRVYVSDTFRIVHHWSEESELSDHNPVFATVVTNNNELSCWEKFKAQLPGGSPA